MARKRMNPFDRFEPEAMTGCFLWTGPLSRAGYGKVHRHMYGEWLAHRLFWVREKGQIPSGMMVCHRCDTPACVNPDHMFLGTAKDNAQDMAQKGRSGITKREDQYWVKNPDKCWFRGTASPMSKLVPEQVAEIRKLRLSGSTLTSLAAKFGLTKSSISKICLNRTHK